MDISTVAAIESIWPWTVIRGDNLYNLWRMPDESVDLFMGSPPYNLEEAPSAKAHPNSRRGSAYDHQSYGTYFDGMPEAEYQALQIFTLNEMARVLRKTGSIIYVHKDRNWNGDSISPRSWLDRTILKVRQQLVWDRGTTHQNNLAHFAQTYEWLFWLTRTDFYGDVDFPFRLPKHMPGIIRIPNDFSRTRAPKKGRRKHHAQYTPALARLAVDLLTEPGETVCDPWCGVGNTGIACVERPSSEQRRFIGFELDDDFAEEARDALTVFKRALF